LEEQALKPLATEEEYNGNMRLGTNSAIFILFFGVAVIQAIQTQNWLMVLMWVAIGSVFLWADIKKK
jgi:uncharacterized membrane protein